MELVGAYFDVVFLQKHDLGVEFYYPLIDKPGLAERFKDYVKTIHLPYNNINLAADDEKVRRASVDMLKESIVRSKFFDVRTMVLHPCGVFQSQKEDVGSYSPLIDSLREIADFMATDGLILSLENQVLRHPDLRIIAGCSCEEWLQLYKDVNRSNVTLTLDTSHAASAVAHEEVISKRYEKLWEFMAHPELISHFHWSDARLATNEAQYGDMHLVPGQGDLPEDFHKAIWQHPGSKLYEQKCSPEEMVQGLSFARSL